MPLVATLLFAATWKTYPLGGVILQLPGPPRTVANEYDTRVWATETENLGETVVLTSSPMTPFDSPPLTLAMTVQGGAGGYRGKLVAQRDLVLNGWPGIEGRVESEGMPTARIQAFRVKDRLFVVLSTLDEKSNDRIFGSIALAARFGKGPQGQAGPVWRRAALGGLSVELPDEATVEADRLTGSYANRAYTLSVSKLDPKRANLAALEANGAKAGKTEAGILGDAASERAEGSAVEGKMTFRAESATVDGRTVTLTAFVPTSLRDAPEVKRFFGSFRAAAK